MSKLKDTDRDGIPDVIEDAIEDAKEIKGRFGVKMILVVMLVGLIVAGYGVGAFFYLDMKDKFIMLQGQYDQATAQWEIDERYQLIKERDKLLVELKQKQAELDSIYEKAAIARERAVAELKGGKYKKENEDEANKMDTNQLLDRFGHYGLPAVKRTR